MASESGRQPSAWWNITQSWWLLVVVGTFGFLGGAALLTVGARARRPLWVLAGVVHLVPSGAALALVDEGPAADELFMWLLLASWVAGSAFAVSINPEFLRIKWNRKLEQSQAAATKRRAAMGRPTGRRAGSSINKSRARTAPAPRTAATPGTARAPRAAEAPPAAAARSSTAGKKSRKASAPARAKHTPPGFGRKVDY
jgi:pyruvate/2-oxoglutarate dehydrogenase complex dihydrolipoamide acyltransferase (E2) component